MALRVQITVATHEALPLNMPPGAQSTGVANWPWQEACLARGSQAGDKQADPPASMVLAVPCGH